MKTGIHHVTYHGESRSIYVQFRDCNFGCKGCIRRNSPWDLHLPLEELRRLGRIRTIDTMSLEEFEGLIEGLDVSCAVLGGGEPTVDPLLPRIVEVLTRRGVDAVLLTNAWRLSGEYLTELGGAGLREVCVSMKAVTPEVHKFYTGVEVGTVLRNFRELYERGFELRAESIYIPGLVEVEEVERVAKFVASVDVSIPYRIDAYCPVKGAPWREPTVDEVLKAAEAARRHLSDVSFLHPETHRPRGVVRCVYPRV